MTVTLETEVMRHLNRLCVEIGPRPIGSAQNHAAAEYITNVFMEAGLEVEAQPFDCPEWQELETRLIMNGERLEATANTFSPSCEIVAPTVPVSTITLLEAAELEGKIALLYGDLTRDVLTAKGCKVYTVERDLRIIQILEEKKPAAIITVSLHPDELIPLIEDWEFDIPSATVTAGTGQKLLENAGQPVSLKISASRKPGHSAIIVGRKAGKSLNRIVLCAHYDTKFGTPGALDNGSGISALLALASKLGRKELETGLELVAFSAEEYYGLDDVEYIRYNGDRLGTILAAINMDGIGQRLGTHTVAIFANSSEFQAEVAGILETYPAVIWTDPWPQSNHSTFAWRGVPSLAISSVFIKGLDHQSSDTVEWIGEEKLEEVISLVQDIVARLQGKPLGWTRPPQAILIA